MKKEITVVVFVVFLILSLTFFSVIPIAAEDGRIIAEGLVNAPIQDVWKAFTTREGIESWMAAHGDINLAIGGKMRTHYDPKGSLGDPKTIENTILCYDEPRMFSIKVSKAPEDFPFLKAVTKMWTVIYLDPVGVNQTKVSVVGQGFGGDEESRKMRDFFKTGNEETLQGLQKQFPSKAGKPVVSEEKKGN